MRLYIEIAKRSFQMQLVYRTANLAGLTTNSFWGALRSFLFIGLYQGRGIEAGWSVQDAVDYVWIAQALIMPLHLWGWWEIALTIRSGDVASDLAKPFDYYGYWLSRDAGRAVYHILFRGVPTLLIGVALFGAQLPPDLGRWGWFLLSVAVAVWISFGLRFLYNVAAFWLLDYRGVGILVMVLTTSLSGFLVPLNYFPDWLQPVVGWLPFAGMTQAPVEVLLGRREGAALAEVLGFQLAWALALMAAGWVMMAAAERKVVVQGG
jgi:ABC-2 type transport system permease protein